MADDIAQRITALTELAAAKPETLSVVVADPDLPGKKTKKIGYGKYLRTYNRSAGEIVKGLSNDDLDFKEDFGNIIRYGATGDGVTDDTIAIQNAIDVLDTGIDTVTGGIVFIPRGTYKIISTITIDGGGAEGLSSITFRGEGFHNTILSCASGFTGVDAVSMSEPTFCRIEELQILGNNNTTNGLHIAAGSEIVVDRVFCQNHTGSCFLIDGAFVLSMRQCRSKAPLGLTGFDFSGGFNTALDIANCYALDTLATGRGFLIADMSYSTFTSCAADNTGQNGYQIRNTQGVTLTSCGAEGSKRSSWLFSASATNDTASIIKGTRCTLNECFSVGADIDALGFGSVFSQQLDTSVIDVVVNRFQEFSNASTVSVATNAVALDHKLKIIDGNFLDSISGVGVHQDPTHVQRVDSLSITGANTPVISLSSLFGSTVQYSGLLHVIAGNGVYSTTSVTNMAAYVLLVTESSGGSSVVEIAKNGLTAGAAANHPSFTWTIDTTNNDLEATPVASTTGSFFFYITKIGGIAP